jgi:integrase
MAEKLLSDARVKTATRAKDGPYLRDGGGLRVRLLEPSRRHPTGARLFEYHTKLRGPDGVLKSIGVFLGTLGQSFTDADGNTRAFTLGDARIERDRVRILVGKGMDPRVVDRLAELEKAEAIRTRVAELEQRMTVRAAAERWILLYVTKHRADGGEYVRRLFENHVFPEIGHLPAETLTGERFAQVIDKISGAGQRRTANVVLATFRQLVRWAGPRGWFGSDPTAGLTKSNAGGRERARERALSSDEISELATKLPASGLPERTVLAVWTLLATGARIGELSGARIQHFDFKKREWVLPVTKNGDEHLIHLSDFAIGHLRQIVAMAGQSPWLLPARQTDADEDALKPIDAKTLGKQIADRQRTEVIKGRAKPNRSLVLAGGTWTAHDLRRTMATRMRALRVSSDTIERCLNHRPQGLVAVYQRSDLLEERREAFDLWGAELARLTGIDHGTQE